MIRQTARPAPASRCALALAAAAWLLPAAPLGAQQTFSLPPPSPTPSPTPTPAPAGPADERAGVEIPPRAAPSATPEPAATPASGPSPAASAPTPPLRLPTRENDAAPAATSAAPASSPAASVAPETAPAPQTPPATPDVAQGAAAPLTAPDAANAEPATAPADDAGWWPYLAGGLGALALLGTGALLWRRRTPRVPQLPAPALAGAAPAAPPPQDPPRLDLMLEITAASRSLMTFTLEYRLVIANRSARAVNDARVAVQLVCARSSGGGAPSAGAAQGLVDAGRIGPHQSRTVTGTVQLPLSAITPLRQGRTPLFVPLAHVTLAAEGLPAQARTFVIGMPSTLGGTSGRVHPIALDVPPGGIAGLVAQAVTLPPVPAAA
jgi:hypothetical protein